MRKDFIKTFFVGISVVLFLIFVATATAAVLHVPGEYATIQDAINVASVGDTIIVAVGTYTEWQSSDSASLVINKSLYLQGSGDDCIIQGPASANVSSMSYGDLVKVSAAGVEITGFKFSGATATETEQRGATMFAIKANTADNLYVHNNTFTFYSQNSLQVQNSIDVLFENNRCLRETRSVWYKPPGVEPGSYRDITRGGAGPSLWHCNEAEVKENSVTTRGVGIFLYGCSDTLLEGNQVSAPEKVSPSDEGIHIQSSSNITVRGNTVSNFTHGDSPYYNQGIKGAGIWISSGCDTITIEKNGLIDNSVGIYASAREDLSSPTNIEVHQNNLTGNAHYGVLNIKYPLAGSWKHWDYHLFSSADSTINAELNYWDHQSGPTDLIGTYEVPICNPDSANDLNSDGEGDKVSENVDYCPWLDSPYSPVISVAIDIKPGSDQNTINLSSAGVISVAILSSDTFDATTVDPGTVTLAGAVVKMAGKSEKYLSQERDVNGDGLLDLVCQVLTAAFKIEPGASTAVLEAETFGGQSIRGEDFIRIVPNN